MESEALFKKAGERLRNASYLLGEYPILRDAKLLASATRAVFEAAEAAMTGILQRERELKRIPVFPDNFEVKLELFKDWAAKRNLSEKHSGFLREMKDAMSQPRGFSPEFVKKAISAGRELVEEMRKSTEGETDGS